MLGREWAVKVKLSFELNKFWADDDSDLDHIETAHQEAFLHFAQDVLLDDPTLAKNASWHSIAFRHTYTAVWFFFSASPKTKMRPRPLPTSAQKERQSRWKSLELTSNKLS